MEKSTEYSYNTSTAKIFWRLQSMHGLISLTFALSGILLIFTFPNLKFWPWIIIDSTAIVMMVKCFTERANLKKMLTEFQLIALFFCRKLYQLEMVTVIGTVIWLTGILLMIWTVSYQSDCVFFYFIGIALHTASAPVFGWLTVFIMPIGFMISLFIMAHFYTELAR